MDEKELLILRLKNLINIHRAKQDQFTKDNNFGPEVGCITRESCMIAMLIPKMQSMGITLDDCK